MVLLCSTCPLCETFSALSLVASRHTSCLVLVLVLRARRVRSAPGRCLWLLWDTRQYRDGLWDCVALPVYSSCPPCTWRTRLRGPCLLRDTLWDAHGSGHLSLCFLRGRPACVLHGVVCASLRTLRPACAKLHVRRIFIMDMVELSPVKHFCVEGQLELCMVSLAPRCTPFDLLGAKLHVRRIFIMDASGSISAWKACLCSACCCRATSSS